MRKQTPLIAFAACIATLSSVGIPTAQAKQKCRAAMPSNQHGYWSWRLIDGRQCWYEGKPMLSKSLLEWPAQASAQPNSDGELTSVLPEKPGNPLDSQARAPNDSDTFAVASYRNDALGVGFAGIVSNDGIGPMEAGRCPHGNYQQCAARRKRLKSVVSAPCLHLSPDASTSDPFAR